MAENSTYQRQMEPPGLLRPCKVHAVGVVELVVVYQVRMGTPQEPAGRIRGWAGVTSIFGQRTCGALWQGQSTSHIVIAGLSVADRGAE